MDAALRIADAITLAVLALAAVLALYGIAELILAGPVSYPFGSEQGSWLYRSAGIYLSGLSIEVCIAIAPIISRRWLGRVGRRVAMQSTALLLVTLLHLL